ncbi:bi-domain-containing oxidoreductase [Patescibacteria group bacterium]|nr:bi-domain-containing oxidoreductase [Patescibacteria group bacterium]
MKQIFQNFKTGEIELIEVPAPIVKEGCVLIKNHYSLLSLGTEKSAIRMGKKSLIEKARARPDLVREVLNKMKQEGLFSTYHKTIQKLDELLPLGYSSAGEVIAVGEGVEDFSVRDRVACGGQGYACHAEIINVPKNLCVKIPKNVSFKEAAFTTLGAIAIQGVRRANLTPGEKVAVIGLGFIGQLTVQILKGYGFPVIGFDIKPEKVKRAQSLGMEKGGVIDQEDIENLVKGFTKGQGLDAVIITAATRSNQPIELAGKILREKGRVSVVGDIGLDIPRRLYYKKEIDLLISRSYGPGRYDKEYEEKGHDYPIGYVRWTEKRNMEEFLRLASEKKIQPENLITHTFDIEQVKQAYKLILENPKQEEIIGVLFSYDVKKRQEDTIFLKESKEYKGKKQINIGLIGVGNFAQNIVLPIIQEIKTAKIYGIADTEGGKAERVAKKYKGEYATCNYRKIIADPNIDLVIIATRHNLHAKITIEALKNNKNVHVEKPLALNEQKLKEVIKAAKSSRGRLMVGFNRRFAPLILEAKKIFTAKHYPLMMLYRVNAGFISKEHWVHDPVEGGGRILGEVCHFVDLLQFLANSPPQRIYASLIPLARAITTQDNLIVTIDFENGSRGVIIYTSLGDKGFPKEYIEIYGPEKVMTIDDFKGATIFAKKGKKSLKGFGQDKGHRDEFKKFIEAIQQGKPSLISLKELFYSTQATFAILKSIKGKKVIDVSINL